MIEATFENFASVPMPDYEELVRAAEKARIISQAVLDNLPMNGEWLRCICGVQRTGVTEGDTGPCETEESVAAAPAPVADSEAPPIMLPQAKTTKSGKIDRGKIMALHNAGWSQAKIADEMGCSCPRVSQIIKEEAECR